MSSFRMFQRLASILLISAFLITASALVARQNQAAPALSSVVSANSQFAIALYQNINAANGSGDRNIFISPFSISTALAMTYAGSRGNTRKQMAAVLNFNGIPEGKLNSGFASLLGETKAAPGKHYKLNVANALWGQEGYHFEADFTSAIGKYYEGGFRTVDFIRASDASRERINKWVEDKTADKIKNLLHRDDVNALTRLVLTNAIYFKGDWASKFEASNTRTAPFTTDSGKIVNVPMMEQTGSFPFMESPEVKMLELPYAGDDLAMIVILPAGDTQKFGAELSLAKLQELQKEMHSREVRVFLPRYEFETRYYLEKSLAAMGMPDAFSESRADFSGMTGRPSLYISHVIHQAKINVNEEGSEAAAATAVVMSAKSIMLPATFRADKPFIFMIVHKPTGSILFMGRVSSPPAAAAAGK